MIESFLPNDLIQIEPFDVEKFKSLDNEWFLSKIPLGVDKILWDSSPLRSAGWTPREQQLSKVWSVVPFYYLRYLVEITPAHVIDLGCGANFFKPYFQNLIGFDPNHDNADIAVFDGTEYDKENFYDAVIAMNSLHFIPFADFLKIFDKVSRLLRVGGRAFVTVNMGMLTEMPSSSIYEISSILNEAIKSLPYKLIVVNQLYFPNRFFKNIGHFGDGNEGNIRIVFEK